MSPSFPELVYPMADTVLRLPALLLGRGYPLHRNESIRPFFIVGSGRCGSTLLRRILQGSPQVHIPPETYVLRAVIDRFLRNRDRSWSDLVHLTLSRFEFHPNFDVFGISLRQLANRIIHSPSDQRTLAFILDSLYRHHGKALGEVFERWGDKTPLNVYCLGRILAVFPEAQFINVIRDGVDVVCSMLRKSGNQQDLAHAALRWKTSISAARKFALRHPGVCHQVRYEDLVKYPHRTTERVCEFLGITFHASMIESLNHGELLRDLSTYAHHANVSKPIVTDSIGKGRRELTREQRIELQRAIGRELAQLAYNPAV